MLCSRPALDRCAMSERCLVALWHIKSNYPFKMSHHCPCATTHVHRKATSRTAQYYNHICTICQRKVPMAVTVVEQRHIQDFRSTEPSRSRYFQRPSVCLSASESSPRCLKPLSARKPQKRSRRVATKGLEHPNIPRSKHRRVVVPRYVPRTP